MKNISRKKLAWCTLIVASSVVVGGWATQVASSAPAAQPASADQPGRIGSEGRGWVAKAGHVKVTRDSGKSFSLLASLPVPSTQVDDVAVLAGAVQVAAIGSSGPRVFLSTDNGGRWSEVHVAPASGHPGAASFVQDSRGLVGLQVTDQTSANFSSGEWFAPQSDGTWAHDAIPVAGRVSSAGSSLWIAGGPQTASLYRSADSGRTWTSASPAKGCALGGAAYAPPQESAGGALILGVSAPGATAGEVTLLSCASNDRGATWHSNATKTVMQNVEAGVVVPSDVGGNSLWFVLPDGSSVVRASVDGTLTAATPTGLPTGVESVSAQSDLVASATTSTTSCLDGKQSCTTVGGVFKTVDGGQTWTQVTAP
jgi:hypothetical protein